MLEADAGPRGPNPEKARLAQTVGSHLGRSTLALRGCLAPRAMPAVERMVRCFAASSSRDAVRWACLGWLGDFLWGLNGGRTGTGRPVGSGAGGRRGAVSLVIGCIGLVLSSPDRGATPEFKSWAGLGAWVNELSTPLARLC